MESSLQQANVPLKDGLDLFNPRLEASPGSLMDCRNYEVLDSVGYKKIDGFERFDGTASNVTSNYYLIAFSGSGGSGEQLNGVDPADAFPPGNRLIINNRSAQPTLPFGTILSRIRFGSNAWLFTVIALVSESSGSWVLPTDYSIVDFDDDNHPSLNSGTTTSPVTITRVDFDSPILDNESLGVATEDIVGYLNDNYQEALLDKKLFPWWDGAARPHGLHWFKDRLYAVADCEYVYLVSNGAVADGALFPGEIFTFGTVSFELVDFQLLEGSLFASGAVVKCLVRRIGSVLLEDEHLTDGGSTRASGTTLKLYSTAVPTLTSGITDPDPWGAVLYRSTSETQATAEALPTGWNPIDMGLEVNFVGGTGTPVAELTREFYEAPVTASTLEELDCSGAGADGATGTIVAFASTVAGPDYGAAIATASDGQYLFVTKSGDIWSSASDMLDLRGFDASDLPDDCFITGIEVYMQAATRAAGGTNTASGHDAYVPEMYLSGFERLSQNRGSIISADYITGDTGYNYYTWGGDRDLWGIGDLLTIDNIRDSNWGFRARFLPTSTLSSGEHLRIEHIYIKIYYVPATSRVYIGDTNNRVSADVVRIHVRRDDDASVNVWSNAEGTMHVYNITNNANGTRSWIQSGDGVYLAASGGSAVATVSGTKGSMLPTLSQITTKQSRYEMITANYYAREDWESIYGVSGAGRAFAYDDKYFRKIYTELDSTVDVPRHIAYYRNYLALGYKTGNVLLSAITDDGGPEPENFKAADDALAFNFNDKVYGLLALPDTSLGVFCENSIHRLILTPDGNLNQSAISPSSGILEYTLAPLGQTAVFCDRRGIRSLEQVDAYGDFIGRPLSYKLGSWLRSRLTVFRPYSGGESITAPVVAYSVRNKNQYRIWFRDGQQLTMTLLGPQEEPIFTRQLFVDSGGELYVPIALSNGIDQYGRERIHFSHYAPWLASTDDVNTNEDKLYVFELERGWHFDVSPITCSMQTNFNVLDNPVAEATLKKVRLYGTSHGFATLSVKTANAYTASFSTTNVDISLPRDSDTGIPVDQRWYSNIANVSDRGQHISVQINHNPSTGEPSHTLQGLILDYSMGKMVT